MVEGGHIVSVAKLKGADGVQESQGVRGESDDSGLWDTVVCLVRGYRR